MQGAAAGAQAAQAPDSGLAGAMTEAGPAFAYTPREGPALGLPGHAKVSKMVKTCCMTARRAGRSADSGQLQHHSRPGAGAASLSAVCDLQQARAEAVSMRGPSGAQPNSVVASMPS